LRLKILPGDFSVWRLDPDHPRPSLEPGSFHSVTHTKDELSIVSLSTEVPSGVTSEPGWRCLKVEGPLPFNMTGVVAGLSAPLARVDIPIFVVSTYDTDYLLIKAADLDSACSTLRDNGHQVSVETLKR
jgi:hypothetical protein